jgi:hypothetical protein
MFCTKKSREKVGVGFAFLSQHIQVRSFYMIGKLAALLLRWRQCRITSLRWQKNHMGHIFKAERKLRSTIVSETLIADEETCKKFISFRIHKYENFFFFLFFKKI